MKLRAIAPLAMAATAAAIGFAPIAAADATVHQNQGNAEITAHPGPAASHAAQLQQPFGGDMGALISTTDNNCPLRAGELLIRPARSTKHPAGPYPRGVFRLAALVVR